MLLHHCLRASICCSSSYIPAFIYGAISLGLGYLVKELGGTLTQVAVYVHCSIYYLISYNDTASIQLNGLGSYKQW